MIGNLFRAADNRLLPAAEHHLVDDLPHHRALLAAAQGCKGGLIGVRLCLEDRFVKRELREIDTDVGGREIPIVWRIELPSLGLDLTTSALNPRAWMATRTPYWEGPIHFEGTHGGRGHLEMTGY
jgi:hypothetical protein